jgi:geranylgeranyl pyrophosphate synthase
VGAGGTGIAFADALRALRPAVDGELDRRLPAADEPPERLHEAMRYSVFAGGKRVRAALVVAAGETCGAARPALLPGAAAIELIHTYSLVHDDLPALDDDDLRRGQPSLHRRYDEATAILAGDALLTLGLTLLAAVPETAAPALRRRAVELVGEAIGTAGMIGGQALDLEAERSWPADPAAMLEWIHRRKTGALITAAVRLGGLYAGAGAAVDERLAALGARLGLMFQIADDILDVEGSPGSLGKAVRKDAPARKLTYPALHGLAASKRALADLREEARELAATLAGGGGPFPSLIDFLATRSS